MNKLNYLWAVPTLFVASVIVGALGGDTTHYQCKYVNSIEVKVSDTSKYGDAAYLVHYSDGTIGGTSSLRGDDTNAPDGIENGVVCQTVFNWGWPYSFSNRDINNESLVK
jgi:hypothetical protein